MNTSSPRLRVLGLLIFSLAWLVPDHYAPWLSFHSEALAFVGLALLLMCVLHDRRPSLNVPAIAIWILLGACIPWIQYMGGVELFFGDALICSLYVLGLFFAVVVGANFGPPPTGQPFTGFNGLMFCICGAALISSAIALAQWLGQYGDLGLFIVQTNMGARASGNLGQPNQLATLLLMGMAAYLYAYESSRIGRLAFLSGIVFMSIALVLTQSRTGLVSAFVMAAFLAWRGRLGILRVNTGALCIWLILIAVGVIALPHINDVLGFGSARELGDPGSAGERWTMWRQTVYALFQSPWVGYGWNQTPIAHSIGALAFPGTFTYSSAHNFFLDILTWNGLVLGGAVSLGTVYWLISRGMKCCRPAPLIAFACLLPLGVHSLFEYPYTYGYFIVIAGLLIGVVESSINANTAPTRSLRPIRVALVVWLMVGVSITYEYFVFVDDFHVSQWVELKIGPVPADFEKVPDLYVLTHLRGILLSSRTQPARNMAAADIDNLRKVALRFSIREVHFKYLLSLALNGEPAGARQQMAILRAQHGEIYYLACKQRLQSLAFEQYPELVAMRIF